ncbi:MAG TPA: hypothetical protein VFE36_03545 [Candidatus Baltobacteraceae bacterium]|jgi:hypothetical protein|nr:hypothetical protein [Candidatus Baltobacteraceae bacterium]
MNFGRVLYTTCAIAFIAPITGGTATTVAYITGAAPTCTTKDAHKPNVYPQRPNATANWYVSAPQSQMTTRMPRGQNVNDFPSPMNTFPTVFVQPVDTDKNGQKPSLTVSTCEKKP